MIRISDIMDKEVINVKNGKRMGFITDIEMDTNEGEILSFTIEGNGGMNFFSRNYDGQVVFGMI
ncbi:YlmC/YmxH family sporulation protein [Paraclostridium bifermentans]|uniref:YlmC/YmxH family sporulation protein n=1 Tax=Paraclostridium bifermentans TaxID=1490 RepID=A0ABY8R2S2_PARBF|nr:YlmC/YmxH family sporulation protein [Paraclostridium bifermentans]